ncbi:hypothetical protein NYO99_13905 [Pelomonas sp. UHG3]|uniref:Uncharacterized protein n=1 Tax=Roseateles hydrophilus TaxID=2975054 RepID=A0ACC6CCC1_9BURK|nr:hypothetical protein [Pelomonas sp. UHG3]MCY4746076.1 hypothetical protein [Pelomonas sp. UHG3]
MAALCCSLALGACAHPEPPARPASATEADSVRLARELRALIGTASCTSDAQCRTVAVGAKACGGPAGYWAWSTLGTDGERVQALARRQAEAHRREIDASGMRSNCALTTDPGAACVAGRCTTATPAAAR